MPSAGLPKRIFIEVKTDRRKDGVTKSNSDLSIANPQSFPFRLDRAFVVLALIFGNALIVINPPFQTADEAQHFFRAWQITRGDFISREKDALGEAGGILPTSLQTFWLQFKPMAMHPEVKTSARKILDAFKIPVEPRTKSLMPFGNTAHYFPAGYLPQSIGIALGRAMSLPLPLIFYLGREANLIAFTFIGFLSLRSAPAIARPIFLLLLIPTMLSLAASMSADTLSDALAILFTALICKYFSAGPASFDRKAYLLILLVTIPLSVGKLVYCPMLALLFLIPAQNFGGSARKAALVFALIALNLSALTGWAANTSSLDTKITTQKNVSPPEQLSRLEQHPLHFGTLLWNTAKDGGWFVTTTYVAVIGWMDLNFPPLVVIAYLVILLFACWTAGDRAPLPAPVSATAIIFPVVILSSLGIALLNFLYWTPLGSIYILGLQGRYFFPLTPAIFLLACSTARRLPPYLQTRWSETRLNAAVVMISFLFCTCLLISVYCRFYVG
jgi:uncharacterized membrane protein